MCSRSTANTLVVVVYYTLCIQCILDISSRYLVTKIQFQINCSEVIYKVKAKLCICVWCVYEVATKQYNIEKAWSDNIIMVKITVI